ncbi:hypothetical protein ASG25_02135 [Rhizobium sp. Leaf384]|uniref:hypothetical protein n=1 Tax=unclassified Rhizobium TaxID=2613769 RepID=UPI000713D47F|nr:MULTISPECIES: hypothetical protein [unclassified Rhizobium]KQR73400.1 hypothetical protein ASG03_00885 [Rhizobium sp. Leaf341]KQS80432.1 hypothetical protein ASG25_02135 [Rhizobium sp. Leaf384]KQS86481.1 hypothetical protein ASG58_17200 [Rhizobium sp. Leaf383]
MKHKRGIDLRTDMAAPFAPARMREGSYDLWRPIGDLAQYEIIGGTCPTCDHVGWLDMAIVRRRVGAEMSLLHFQEKLVCRCGNRDGNRLMIGTLAR